MKKRIVVLTMAVLFGLSAVACGSEGGSSSGGQTHLQNPAAPVPQTPEL